MCVQSGKIFLVKTNLVFKIKIIIVKDIIYCLPRDD